MADERKELSGRALYFYLGLYAAALLVPYVVLQWAYGARKFSLIMSVASLLYVVLFGIYHWLHGRSFEPAVFLGCWWRDWKITAGGGLICFGLWLFIASGTAEKVSSDHLMIGFAACAFSMVFIAARFTYQAWVAPRPVTRPLGGAKRLTAEEARAELEKRTAGGSDGRRPTTERRIP